MITLKNWSVCGGVDESGYTPPECRTTRVQGEAYGVHLRLGKLDGKKLITGPLVKVSGLVVRTENGTEYRLDGMSAEYVKWLGEKGMSCDPLNPIKMK